MNRLREVESEQVKLELQKQNLTKRFLKAFEKKKNDDIRKLEKEFRNRLREVERKEEIRNSMVQETADAKTAEQVKILETKLETLNDEKEQMEEIVNPTIKENMNLKDEKNDFFVHLDKEINSNSKFAKFLCDHILLKSDSKEYGNKRKRLTSFGPRKLTKMMGCIEKRTLQKALKEAVRTGDHGDKLRCEEHIDHAMEMINLLIADPANETESLKIETFFGGKIPGWKFDNDFNVEKSCERRQLIRKAYGEFI